MKSNKKENRCVFCKRTITVPNRKIPVCPKCVGTGTKWCGVVD